MIKLISQNAPKKRQSIDTFTLDIGFHKTGMLLNDSPRKLIFGQKKNNLADPGPLWAVMAKKPKTGIHHKVKGLFGEIHFFE